MKKIKNNITLINILSSVGLQIVTIVCGFVIPRLTLSIFGSEVNGLVASLGQFLSYINLAEGGLGGVVTAALYKPLVEKDDKKISSVVKAAQSFYHKVALVFIVYTLIVAVVYPVFINKAFSFEYIFTLTIILSLTLFMQYNFSLAQQLLLRADKKIYLVSIVQSIVLIASTVVFFIASRIATDIHILKITTALVYIIQPVVFSRYVKKHYDINKNVAPDKKLLKQRWDGFAINIAAFIHTSTDVAVLTFFTDLKVVSIYSVYALVTSGLKKFVQSISSAMMPNMGHLYAKGDPEELKKNFSIIEYVSFMTTYLLFTVGMLLITPFVILYTRNINDADYNQLLFGVILILSEFVYCLREPYVNLAYSANRFRDIRKHAYIEAALNIVLSVILVNIVGLIGVAIGSLVAMLYRTVFQIVYLRKHILHRSLKEVLKRIFIFAFFSAISIAICLTFIPFRNSIMSFIICGLSYTVITISLYAIMSLIFFKKALRMISRKK